MTLITKTRTSRLLSSTFLLLSAAVAPTLAATKDLGNGFADHGVAVPISNHRGTVATVDANGHNILLQWLMDHTGGYCLLLLNASTGQVQQFNMPFKFTEFDAPYASILSSKNKFYTHLNNRFVEFDPDQRAFTAVHTSAPQMAMAMTEDDAGRIWSATYPSGGLVSYDPATKQFTDYGHVHNENWKQYNRALAADDAGWIYFGVGSTSSQIVAFDPQTRKATPILPEADRKPAATGHVYRDENGKVYGQAAQSDKEPWYELHKGQARKLDAAPTNPKPRKYRTGSQTLNETTFPDGTRATSDLVNRTFTVENPKTNQKKEYKFDYTSDGAIVMGLIALPDGSVCGGTAFPMRFYRFDPRTDTMEDRVAYGQWNTVSRQGDRVVVFGYPSGYLLDFDATKPWVPTAKDNPNSNPKFITQCTPVIHRPHDLLTLPDGHRVVAGGTPQYGHTGGGLLFWDRRDNSRTLLKDSDLIPDQSAHAMAYIENEKILVGTTTTPGSGGEKKAKQATLYILDLATRKIDWQQPLFPGAQEYTDFYPGPNGLIYGLVDSHTFFVFDPVARKIVHQFDAKPTFGLSAHEQGPRLFHRNPSDTSPDAPTYLLFQKGIAKIDPKSHTLSWVAKSPVHIHAGGDIVDNRLYFISESHVCSYQLK